MKNRNRNLIIQLYVNAVRLSISQGSNVFYCLVLNQLTASFLILKLQVFLPDAVIGLGRITECRPGRGSLIISGILPPI